ncbi:MAG TPA: alpha/beta hydrolase [Bacilli bacterium]|nr:alpha/beta hydrolase [Bacilli bacterium]
MPFAVGKGEANLYYETVGAHQVAIIFIHPPAMGMHTFFKQRTLANKYKLIFFDLRGNGRSDAGHLPISIELLADDVKVIIDAEKLDKVVVVGYSNGGSIAQEFALRYPERVHAVILSGGFSEVSTTILDKQFRLGMWVTKYLGLQPLAYALAVSHFPKTEQPLRGKLYKDVLRANCQVVHAMYKVGHAYISTTKLATWSVPLLLVYGDSVEYLRKYEKMFQRYIADCDIVRIKRATHQVPTRHSKELNELIDTFVKKIT